MVDSPTTCSRCGQPVRLSWDHLDAGEFGERWRCKELLAMQQNAWFTVVGAYADTKEAYVAQVQAVDGVAAKSAAYREADGVVIGLSVFPGRIDALKEDTKITPLRAPQHAVTVSQVSIVEKRVAIPARCPSCRADLRQPQALLCADVLLSFWQGHLTKDNDDIKNERDQEHLPSNLRVASVARVQCAGCQRVMHAHQESDV